MYRLGISHLLVSSKKKQSDNYPILSIYSLQFNFSSCLLLISEPTYRPIAPVFNAPHGINRWLSGQHLEYRSNRFICICWRWSLGVAVSGKTSHILGRVAERKGGCRMKERRRWIRRRRAQFDLCCFFAAYGRRNLPVYCQEHRRQNFQRVHAQSSGSVSQKYTFGKCVDMNWMTMLWDAK